MRCRTIPRSTRRKSASSRSIPERRPENSATPRTRSTPISAPPRSFQERRRRTSSQSFHCAHSSPSASIRSACRDVKRAVGQSKMLRTRWCRIRTWFRTATRSRRTMRTTSVTLIVAQTRSPPWGLLQTGVPRWPCARKTPAARTWCFTDLHCIRQTGTSASTSLRSTRCCAPPMSALMPGQHRPGSRRAGSRLITCCIPPSAARLIVNTPTSSMGG